MSTASPSELSSTAELSSAAERARVLAQALPFVARFGLIARCLALR